MGIARAKDGVMPPVEWRSRIRWLQAWVRIAEFGITLCPFCCAQLDYESVPGTDGLVRHRACNAVCAVCGKNKWRDPQNGAHNCRSWVCSWRKAWDDVVRTRSNEITRVPLVQEAWVSNAPPAARYAEMIYVKLLEEQQKVISDGNRQNLARKWWRVCVSFRALARAMEAQIQLRGRFVGAWGLLQNAHLHDLKRHKQWLIAWKRVAAARVKQGKQLLNPDFENIDDPTTKRFAQLEIG